jgi:hypothetical protein
MTHQVAVIFLIFHFIAVAMLATVWDMGALFYAAHCDLPKRRGAELKTSASVGSGWRSHAASTAKPPLAGDIPSQSPPEKIQKHPGNQ